jgi:SAM-dependent MidA family methyltransferase
VGGVFGELLAFQFAQWLDECGPGALQIVEAGAHDGRLAKDILTWKREHRRELFDRVEYWIIEPSAARQNWQRRTLDEFSGQARFATGFGGLLDARSSHRGGDEEGARGCPPVEPRPNTTGDRG